MCKIGRQSIRTATSLQWPLEKEPITITALWSKFCMPHCGHMPAQPMMPDFSKGIYAECYQSLMKACAQRSNDSSNGITADQCEDGSCFLALDLTHDESGDGFNYTTSRRMGTVGGQFTFCQYTNRNYNRCGVWTV